MIMTKQPGEYKYYTMKIREYQDADRENLRKICLATASPPPKTEKAKKILLASYCDYYIGRERENVFVLDADGEAVGYIFTAANFKTYKKNFRPYLKKIKELSVFRYFIRLADDVVKKILSGKYPAHLHIDILPEFTGKGRGTELLSAALADLRRKKIAGVCLGVASGNKRAIGFYEKNGFATALRLPCCKFMTNSLRNSQINPSRA